MKDDRRLLLIGETASTEYRSSDEQPDTDDRRRQKVMADAMASPMINFFRNKNQYLILFTWYKYKGGIERCKMLHHYPSIRVDFKDKNRPFYPTYEINLTDMSFVSDKTSRCIAHGGTCNTWWTLCNDPAEYK